MSDIRADETRIRELLTRGVESIYPNREFLEEILTSGGRLSVYLGIDPTGPTLHLGHTIQLNKLRQFQELGHRVVLLIGDFTATIGDPTGKSKLRPTLTAEQVRENASKYKKQASHIIDFEGENPGEIKYNSEWLKALSLNDFLKIASNTTVDGLLKRDMFAGRQERGEAIYTHEFLYPLLQGYDSVAMEIDGEIGGNDQVFNMLIGRSLEKTILGKEKFVIANKLLVDPDGVKMGKTEGKMVTLEDSPRDMFGKIMGWPDEFIVPGFELLTDVSIQYIRDIEDELTKGVNLRDQKLNLARTITTRYYGEEVAKKENEIFLSTFSLGRAPESPMSLKVEKGTLLVETLTKKGFVSSKSEFRRLLEQGGVHNMETGDVITDPLMLVEESLLLRIGKHRFLKIEIR